MTTFSTGSGTATSLALTLLLLGTGCASVPSAVINEATSRDLACAGWRQIWLSQAAIDLLPDAAAIQIAEHNLYGKAQGCWE